MLRLIIYIGSLALLGYGGFWLWSSQPGVRKFVEQYVEIGEIHTLEARYTEKQVAERHRGVLLPTSRHQLLEPQLLFYPYLLMEVKYVAANGQTHEGVMLWGLEDGEMVLNTSTWEKTHGFEDCISSKADSNDFRVLFLLAQHPQGLSRTQIADTLHLSTELVDSWLRKAQKKHLIVHQHERYLLHFQKPRIAMQPETKLDRQLVTKPSKQAIRIPRRYSLAQIKKMSEAAFGRDFAIRHTQEVFLPVYSIEVQNPDGSIATTYWNALTGQQIESVW